MTIGESDVRHALERATGHLYSPPGLLDDVRRGGRRRIVRRRTLLAGGLVLGAATLAGGLVTWPPLDGPMDVASPLLDEPTRGDLAGDREFLDRVARVWRKTLLDSDMSMAGEMHAVWAGNTPVGPAAFVIQRTRDNPVASGEYRVFAMCTFIHTMPDGLEPMIVTQMDDGPTDGVPQAGLLGPDADVLVVVDFGAPVLYSPELAFNSDGEVVRTWQPAPFTDGAFVTRIPPQKARTTVAIGRSPLRQIDIVHLANDVVRHPSGQRQPQLVQKALPGADRAWRADQLDPPNLPWDQLEAALRPFLDPCGVHLNGADPIYSIIGSTPDGRRLWLYSLQWDDYPARHLLFLAPPRDGAFTPAGFVSAAPGGRDTLIFGLPARQGTLFARAGAAARYRTAAGWQPAETDAVLVPSDGLEVEVIIPGAEPQRYPLVS
jgi:hypothetical protein